MLVHTALPEAAGAGVSEDAVALQMLLSETRAILGLLGGMSCHLTQSEGTSSLKDRRWCSWS